MPGAPYRQIYHAATSGRPGPAPSLNHCAKHRRNRVAGRAWGPGAGGACV